MVYIRREDAKLGSPLSGKDAVMTPVLSLFRVSFAALSLALVATPGLAQAPKAAKAPAQVQAPPQRPRG